MGREVPRRTAVFLERKFAEGRWVLGWGLRFEEFEKWVYCFFFFVFFFFFFMIFILRIWVLSLLLKERKEDLPGRMSGGESGWCDCRESYVSFNGF